MRSSRRSRPRSPPTGTTTARSTATTARRRGGPPSSCRPTSASPSTASSGPTPRRRSTRPSPPARSSPRRHALGRVRDLPDDLDDVAVRVVDTQLPVGAVAALQDRADPLELRLRAELAGVRLEVAQRAADELGDRHPVPAAGGEVHHRRLEAVAGSEPLVLRGEDPVVRRDLFAAVELL